MAATRKLVPGEKTLFRLPGEDRIADTSSAKNLSAEFLATHMAWGILKHTYPAKPTVRIAARNVQLVDNTLTSTPFELGYHDHSSTSSR